MSGGRKPIGCVYWDRSSKSDRRLTVREALKRIVDERGILDFCHNNLSSKTWEDWDKVYKTLRKWIDEAMSALAAPPRNCDRYATVDEAMDDFADEALIEQWNALKAGKDRDMLAEELFVFTKWLFAPATEQEGGNDGNE